MEEKHFYYHLELLCPIQSLPATCIHWAFRCDMNAKYTLELQNQKYWNASLITFYIDCILQWWYFRLDWRTYIIKINSTCFFLPFKMWLLEYFKLHMAHIIFLLGDTGVVNNSMLGSEICPWKYVLRSRPNRTDIWGQESQCKSQLESFGAIEDCRHCCGGRSGHHGLRASKWPWCCCYFINFLY